MKNCNIVNDVRKHPEFLAFLNTKYSAEEIQPPLFFYTRNLLKYCVLSFILLVAWLYLIEQPSKILLDNVCSINYSCATQYTLHKGIQARKRSYAKSSQSKYLYTLYLIKRSTFPLSEVAKSKNFKQSVLRLKKNRTSA